MQLQELGQIKTALMKYEIILSSFGRVYYGDSGQTAASTFDYYKECKEREYPKYSSEAGVLLTDGTVVQTF